MNSIDQLLSELAARNASDLHIKAGSPPVIRVDGELRPARRARPDARRYQGRRGLDHDRQADPPLLEHNEIDFAYSAPTPAASA